MALSLLPQRRKAYMFGTAWRKRYRPNEPLSVVAVRVSKSRSFARRNQRLRPSPRLQPALGIVDHLRRRFALISTCALTFCNPAVSASICFCWCAAVTWKSF